MADLSPCAQTVLDYAISRAKRTWSKTVNDVHLVAAIRHWDKEWFDSEFSGMAEKIDNLLERQKGDTLKPEYVEPSVLDHLGAITKEVELHDLAKTLIESLRDKLDAPSEISESPTRQVRETHTESDQLPPIPSPVTPSQGKNLQLDRWLIERIADIQCRDPEEIAQIVAADAREVAFRVLNRDDDMLISAINVSLQCDGIPPATRSLSGLMTDLVQGSHGDSRRVATLLALSYVDVAEFAASLDDEVTDYELEQVDAVRLLCREILADKIDVTSDAIMEFESKFGELVGMDSVKKDLRKRVDYLMVSKRRTQRGQLGDAQRMHMAFVGNPGTGKTTVARLFGQLLNNLGLLPSNTFLERDRSGLVGTHVGHTEEKTKAAIRDADGGILFIDEAYALNDRYGNQKGFGEEAVDVLVKEMEDRRDRLVVIFAGYKKPMESFLTVNPGLKSRIPSIIEFPDYSISELLEIADGIVNRRGLSIEEEARTKLGTILEASSKLEGFGNAREVENVIDATQRNLTMRLSPLGNLATDRESRTILAVDVPTSEQAEVTRRIGFGRHLYL